MSKQSRRVRPGSRPAGEPAAPGSVTRPVTGATESRPESRPATGSVRPSTVRAGRRERARPSAPKPFFERFRGPIIGAVVVAAVALMAVWAFTSSSAAAYTCSVEYQAPAASSPEPEGQVSGFLQENMGTTHAVVGDEATYLYCPPASGPHYNSPPNGPIPYRVFGPNDAVGPQGWVHNLEHGGLVVLYRGDPGDAGLTDATQQALRDFAAGLPASPVCGRPANQYFAAARFDDMATPFAALVWGRVLPLETLDTAAIQSFWSTVGEQEATAPERFGCPLPGAAPSGVPAASPSAS